MRDEYVLFKDVLKIANAACSEYSGDAYVAADFIRDRLLALSLHARRSAEIGCEFYSADVLDETQEKKTNALLAEQITKYLLKHDMIYFKKRQLDCSMEYMSRLDVLTLKGWKDPEPEEETEEENEHEHL